MRRLVWSALAAGVLLTAGSAVRADDTIRLGGPSALNNIEGEADTSLVHWRGYGGGYRGGYYGGYRGGYGGYRGGYYGGYRGGYGGYYGGYRGYYGGYRGYWGAPRFWAGYYGGYYGWPRYYASYYSPAYYYPSYTYYSSDYYYPISGASVPAQPLATTGEYLIMPPDNATFPYDGGPRDLKPAPVVPREPIPAPGIKPNPMKAPGARFEGRLVSLPTVTSGGTSLATSPDIERLRFANVPSTPVRVTYPAYGDEPIPAAPRKR